MRRLPAPVRQVARLVVVALLVEFLLLPQLAGTRNSWHLLLDVDNVWLLVALGLEILALLAYGLLTRELLPPAVRPSYGRLLRIDLATMAVSHLVPAGSAVGLGMGYQLLTDSGVPGPQAATAKATQAVGSAVVLNSLLWLALIVSIFLHGFSPVYGPVALAGAVLMTAVAAVAVLLHKRQDRVARRIGTLLGRLPTLSADRVTAAVGDAGEYLRHFLADRPLLVRSSLVAAANWLLDAGTLWACVRAFGHALGPVGLFVAYGIANVLAALPITPAGLGVVEAFLIPALVGFQVPRGVAILGVLAWRALNFLLPIPIGLASYLSLSRRDRESPGATAGARSEQPTADGRQH